VIVLLFQLLNASAFSLLIPSLYKFITTPTTQPEESSCAEEGEFWPGVGGSETDYAWVLSSYPLFEAVAAPLAGALLHRLPFSVTIVSFLTVFIVGGIVYALAESVWMAFPGFGLGAGASLCSITVHTYIGEMGDVLDEIRKKQGKGPRKFVLYIAYSFMLNGGFILPFTLNSIMAQFVISPYHWPGWMHAALTAAVGITTLVFFIEPRSLSQAKLSDVECTCLRGLRVEAKLWNRCIKFASYLFLVGCAYLIGMVYTVHSSLTTPVLSDQFGFSVKYTSYFFLALSAAYVSSSVIQLGAKFAKVDNRKLLFLFLILSLVGTGLYGDWQAITPDPCTNYTLGPFQNSSAWGSGNEEGEVLTSDEGCQSLSGPNDDCFCNRQSRVTGEFCCECVDACLSAQKSHNIYQFSIAAVFLALAAPMGYVFVSAIASDITSINSQGKFASLILGVGSASRTVTPLWFVKSYEVTGRHTYSAMAVNTGFSLVLLLSLLGLYEKLAPIQKSCDVVISATGKLSLEVMEHE
jgi:MFS family permease